MNFLTGLVLILLISGLVQDYRRDPGRYVKAKIFHTICLALICIANASAFAVIGAMIGNFDKYRETFGYPIGVISADMHVLIVVIHAIFSVVILMVAFQLIRRREKARRILIYLLPFDALLEIFGFYRGWMSGNEPDQQSLLAILTGTLLIGGIAAAIILIYNSRMMKAFFHPDDNDISSEAHIIDPDNEDTK